MLILRKGVLRRESGRTGFLCAPRTEAGKEKAARKAAAQVIDSFVRFWFSFTILAAKAIEYILFHNGWPFCFRIANPGVLISYSLFNFQYSLFI